MVLNPKVVMTTYTESLLKLGVTFYILYDVTLSLYGSTKFLGGTATAILMKAIVKKLREKTRSGMTPCTQTTYS